MNLQERVTPGTADPAEKRKCSWLNIWTFLVFALTIKAAFMTICLGEFQDLLGLLCRLALGCRCVHGGVAVGGWDQCCPV
uniref:Uncharacterized protein n=1 Tax=Malurus cyaneus samueli TaxID=2593467 RepID=A0A8C5TB66_9PASS